MRVSARPISGAPRTTLASSSTRVEAGAGVPVLIKQTPSPPHRTGLKGMSLRRSPYLPANGPPDATSITSHVRVRAPSPGCHVIPGQLCDDAPIVLGTVPTWVTVLQLLAAGLVGGFCVLQWVWWRGEVRPASAAWSLAWSIHMALVLLAGGLFALTTPGHRARRPRLRPRAARRRASWSSRSPPPAPSPADRRSALLAVGDHRPVRRAGGPVVGAPRRLRRRRRRARRPPAAHAHRRRRLLRRRRASAGPGSRAFGSLLVIAGAESLAIFTAGVAGPRHTRSAPCAPRCGPSRSPSASRCSRSTGCATPRTRPSASTRCATPWPGSPTPPGSSRTPTGCSSRPATRPGRSCATPASRDRCGRSPATGSSPSCSPRTRSSTRRRPGRSSSTSPRSSPPPPSATS